MTGPVTITVPGKPGSKGRPRFSRKSGTAYTPAKTENAEAFVKVLAVQEMAGRAPMDGPVSVRMAATFDVPASWSQKKRAAALCGLIRPTGKPDLDNLQKLASDALNKIVFRDDAQIVDFHATKAYGPQALTVITVRPLDLTANAGRLGHGL